MSRGDFLRNIPWRFVAETGRQVAQDLRETLREAQKQRAANEADQRYTHDLASLEARLRDMERQQDRLIDLADRLAQQQEKQADVAAALAAKQAMAIAIGGVGAFLAIVAFIVAIVV